MSHRRPPPCRRRSASHHRATPAASPPSAHGLSDAPFYGIAPDAMILPVRVLVDDQKTPNPTAPKRIAEGIIWAVDHGATVVNLSLETPPTQEMTNAIEYAHGKDVVLVAAAGNEG